jgi:hypothetical protein
MIYFLLAVYFLSAFLMWRYVHLAYSYGGIFCRLKPGIADLTFTIFPVCNTVSCLICWLVFYPVERKRKEIKLNKFFNIKL